MTTTSFFFFNDPPTTEIYTLSLHDALPIFLACEGAAGSRLRGQPSDIADAARQGREERDLIAHHRRGGARVRSEEHTSELQSLTISYAVFCLKKKKKKKTRKPSEIT